MQLASSPPRSRSGYTSSNPPSRSALAARYAGVSGGASGSPSFGAYARFNCFSRSLRPGPASNDWDSGTSASAIRLKPPLPPVWVRNSLSGCRRKLSTATNRNAAAASSAAVSRLRAGLRAAFRAPSRASADAPRPFTVACRVRRIQIDADASAAVSSNPPPPKNVIARKSGLSTAPPAAMHAMPITNAPIARSFVRRDGGFTASAATAVSPRSSAGGATFTSPPTLHHSAANAIATVAPKPSAKLIGAACGFK